MYVIFDKNGICHGLVHKAFEEAPEGFVHIELAEEIYDSRRIVPVFENGNIVGVNISPEIPQEPAPQPKSEIEVLSERVDDLTLMLGDFILSVEGGGAV